MKVVVFGAGGMLGSMLIDYISRNSSFELVATLREQAMVANFQACYGDVDLRLFDAEDSYAETISALLSDAKWAINAIGIIKPYIQDNNSAEVVRAAKVNAIFPHVLAKAGADSGCRVIQIATDCVFSGKKGGYVELDSHDPLDAYGKTKSLGEVVADNVHHLRCSIIGPEVKGFLSLLEWFLGQEKGCTVNGFSNHMWNGITTLHFARICQGIMRDDLKLPNRQHVVPSGPVSKADLLRSIARECDRRDIEIKSVETADGVDRTLATNDASTNARIWKSAGYDREPSVDKMVAELARYRLLMGRLTV